MVKIVKGYMGIDPGVNGGLVVVRGCQVDCLPRKGINCKDVWSWVERKQPHSCIIEQVGGYVGGKRPDRGSHMFEFGKTVGHYEMMLDVLDISTESVPPQTWQKHFGLVKGKGDSDSYWKNRIKYYAESLLFSQEMYTGVGLEQKLTLAVSDAFLLAMYCKRMKEKESE